MKDITTYINEVSTGLVQRAYNKAKELGKRGPHRERDFRKQQAERFRVGMQNKIKEEKPNIYQLSISYSDLSVNCEQLKETIFSSWLEEGPFEYEVCYGVTKEEALSLLDAIRKTFKHKGINITNKTIKNIQGMKDTDTITLICYNPISGGDVEVNILDIKDNWGLKDFDSDYAYWVGTAKQVRKSVSMASINELDMDEDDKEYIIKQLDGELNSMK